MLNSHETEIMQNIILQNTLMVLKIDIFLKQIMIFFSFDCGEMLSTVFLAAQYHDNHKRACEKAGIFRCKRS